MIDKKRFIYNLLGKSLKLVDFVVFICKMKELVKIHFIYSYLLSTVLKAKLWT